MPQCQPPSCSNTWRAGKDWLGAVEVVTACSPVMGRLRGKCFKGENSVYGSLCCSAILGVLRICQYAIATILKY